MKRTSFLAVIVAAVLAVISQFFPGTSAAQTPQSYPLVCRGGSSLVIGIAPGVRNIGFTFNRGTKPAREGLAPGECSWVDRGMSAGEPGKLSQHVADSSSSLKAGGELAPENRWYEELRSPDKYWTFMVYSDGHGQLIVTGARPNAEMSVSPRARVPVEIAPTPTPQRPANVAQMQNRLAIPLPSAPSKLTSSEVLAAAAKFGVMDAKGVADFVRFDARTPWIKDKGSLDLVQTTVRPDTNIIVFFAPVVRPRAEGSLLFLQPETSVVSVEFTSAGPKSFYLIDFEGVVVDSVFEVRVDGKLMKMTYDDSTKHFPFMVEAADSESHSVSLEYKGGGMGMFYGINVSKLKM